jgi:hypothetical protein
LCLRFSFTLSLQIIQEYFYLVLETTVMQNNCLTLKISSTNWWPLYFECNITIELSESIIVLTRLDFDRFELFPTMAMTQKAVSCHGKDLNNKCQEILRVSNNLVGPTSVVDVLQYKETSTTDWVNYTIFPNKNFTNQSVSSVSQISWAT